MAQQKIAIKNNGADSRRVLDALTPKNSELGPADDWKELAFAAEAEV